MTLQPVLPTELHGFSVKVGVGSYPPDQPHSHRRAMYAELAPVRPEIRERMRRAGKARILAYIPLTIDGARSIESEPNSRLAEAVAKEAIAKASQLARTVENA